MYSIFHIFLFIFFVHLLSESAILTDFKKKEVLISSESFNTNNSIKTGRTLYKYRGCFPLKSKKYFFFAAKIEIIFI